MRNCNCYRFRDDNNFKEINWRETIKIKDVLVTIHCWPKSESYLHWSCYSADIKSLCKYVKREELVCENYERCNCACRCGVPSDASGLLTVLCSLQEVRNAMSVSRCETYKEMSAVQWWAFLQGIRAEFIPFVLLQFQLIWFISLIILSTVCSKSQRIRLLKWNMADIRNRRNWG
jgi:hypothetical protein